MNHDNLYIDDIANILPSNTSSPLTGNSQKTDEDHYPDALSAAGLVLFVLGLCLSTWFFVQSV